MQYIYDDFTDKQINEAVRAMHSDIHKLLLYKDKTIEEKIFEDDEAFLVFFENVMFKLGGTKTLFNDNGLMVTLMATLQGAMDNFKSDHFSYKKFRRAILDSHGHIKQMFEGGGLRCRVYQQLGVSQTPKPTELKRLVRFIKKNLIF